MFLKPGTTKQTLECCDNSVQRKKQRKLNFDTCESSVQGEGKCLKQYSAECDTKRGQRQQQNNFAVCGWSDEGEQLPIGFPKVHWNDKTDARNLGYLCPKKM